MRAARCCMKFLFKNKIFRLTTWVGSTQYIDTSWPRNWGYCPWQMAVMASFARMLALRSLSKIPTQSITDFLRAWSAAGASDTLEGFSGAII